MYLKVIFLSEYEKHYKCLYTIMIYVFIICLNIECFISDNLKNKHTVCNKKTI